MLSPDSHDPMKAQLRACQAAEASCSEAEVEETPVRRVKQGVCALCITCRLCAQDRTVTCALCERCRVCGVWPED